MTIEFRDINRGLQSQMKVVRGALIFTSCQAFPLCNKSYSTFLSAGLIFVESGFQSKRPESVRSVARLWGDVDAQGNSRLCETFMRHISGWRYQTTERSYQLKERRMYVAGEKAGWRQAIDLPPR